MLVVELFVVDSHIEGLDDHASQDYKFVKMVHNTSDVIGQENFPQN